MGYERDEYSNVALGRLFKSLVSPLLLLLAWRTGSQSPRNKPLYRSVPLERQLEMSLVFPVFLLGKQ